MKVKLASLILALWPSLCFAEPLSAIDWLNEKRKQQKSVATKPFKNQNDGQSLVQHEIEVTPLADMRLDAVGLLSPEMTGMPITLWQDSDSQDLIDLLEELPPLTNPILQSLLFRLMLAEGYAPTQAAQDNSFLKARLTVLMSYGAVEPALALLERAAPLPAPLVPTLFELSLMSENLTPACEQVLDLGPHYPNDADRIFCHARKGDWMTADLMLQTATGLGALSPIEKRLLVNFLDAVEEEEEVAILPPPSHPSPLIVTLYEAIGEPLAAGQLPPAFETVNLTGDHGWKNQLHAAERLKKSGALADNRFLGILTEQAPAASGGVWDRVAFVQDFEAAVLDNDDDALSHLLNQLWTNPVLAPLRGPISRLFADKLFLMPLQGAAKIHAQRMGLLTESFQNNAKKIDGAGETLTLEKAIALSQLKDEGAKDFEARELLNAFHAVPAPPAIKRLVSERKLGEAILHAIGLFHRGSQGNLNDLINAVAAFRYMGLGETAQRAVLYKLILEPET